jgi:hypothetical protein
MIWDEDITQIAEGVRAIKLRPGEDLILEFDFALSAQQAERLYEDAKAALPEPRRVVIVSEGRVISEPPE